MDSAESDGLLLKRQPQLREHTVAPPALASFLGMDAAARDLNGLVQRGSRKAAVHAALGNILVREGRYLDAVEAYRVATECDPAFAEAHLAISELAYVLRDTATSNDYRSRALALRRVYPDPLPVGDRVPVLLLLRDEPYAVNAPIEMILDRRRFALHKFYVSGDSIPAVPPFAVAFTAFGHAPDVAAKSAEAFLAQAGRPFVNQPRHIASLARERLERTLAGIAGLTIVHTERVPASSLPERLVRLVRPADTHAGDGLALIDSTEGLREHTSRFPADEYHVSSYYDYRSADGLFRKYRVIFVDGVAFPYHLAIAPRWMVHYQSAPMREHAWMREEELRFLESPHEAIADWDRVMGAVAQAIELDYFGIDVGLLPDGSVLMFEADSGMLVHDEDPNDVFAPKRPYVGRIREALSEAIEKRRV